MNVINRNVLKHNNPYALLDINFDAHNYSKCRDKKNHNCAKCGYMLDFLIGEYKRMNYEIGRIRLTKYQMEKLNGFFGEEKVQKGISRYSTNEHYKKIHYNIIPCSCPAKSHQECSGYFYDSKMVCHSCKCHRHTRAEQRQLKDQFEGIRGV